jgi:hypothetical protein
MPGKIKGSANKTRVVEAKTEVREVVRGGKWHSIWEAMSATPTLTVYEGAHHPHF